jgi:hypothetical protein
LGNTCGDKKASVNLESFDVRYWQNPNQVYKSGVLSDPFNLGDARSICLQDCPIPNPTNLTWVCDYPQGPINLTMADWASRNYDYFDLLTPTQKNSSTNLTGPCYPVLFQSINCKAVSLPPSQFSLLFMKCSFLSFSTMLSVTSNDFVQLYCVNMIKSIIIANFLQACVLCFCSMWSMYYQGSITCLQEVPTLGLRADWTVTCIDWWVAYSLLELSARSISIKWDTETLDWYWWSEHQFRQCDCPSGAESIVWAHNSG